MKSSFILILSLFCTILVSAQQHKIDSLKALLPSASDTNKVHILNDLAFRLMFSQPEEAQQYTSEAMEHAQNIDFKKGIANTYNTQGMLFDIKGNYEQSIEAYNTGLKIFQSAGLRSDKLYLALHNGLGLVYSRKADYTKALEFYFKSLELAESILYKFAITNILLNIGSVYYDQKEYEKALEYYRKCQDKALEFGETSVVAKAITNMAMVYKDQKRYDEAIREFLKALDLKKGTSDILSLSASYTNLADVYKSLKNYPLALEYLDKARDAKREVDDKWGLLTVDDIRAQIFIAQGKLDKAENIIKKNLATANELGGISKSSVYNRFYELYKAKNDYRTALYWYERKTAYNDSLFNEAKSKQLAELQTLYEVNKKEKEIATLEKDKQAAQFEKNMLIITIFSLAAIALSIGSIIRFRIRKRQQLHDMELKLQQNLVENARLREAELRHEIDFKNKELASYTMNFVQKSELMEELKRNLQEINSSEKEVARKISGISKLIENTYQVDREWEDFKLQFENVHANFFKLLKERCPELTNGDLKLCALLKLNMNMKEAAKILGISPDSVKTARYRLRKKFDLGQDENLVDFIQNIHQQETNRVLSVA